VLYRAGNWLIDRIFNHWWRVRVAENRRSSPDSCSPTRKQDWE